MRRRITAVLTAVIMLVTVMPLTAHAGTAAPATDEMEQARQEIQESLDSVYDGSVQSRTRYCSAVWNSIQKEYSDVSAEISRATSIDELDGLQNEAITLDVLAGYNRGVVRSAGDMPRLKKADRKKIRRAAKAYKKSDYNSFYWDMVIDGLYEIRHALSGARDFIQLAEAEVQIENFAYADEEEVEISLEDSGDISEDYLNEYDEDHIYTKKEVSQIRKSNISLINAYVKDQLAKSHYSGSLSPVQSLRASYVKRIGSRLDVPGINSLATECIGRMEALTGVEFEKVSATEQKRMLMRLEKLKDKYYDTNYTERGWERMEEIYDTACSKVTNAQYAVQLNESIYTGAARAMSRVRTLTAVYKKKYVKKLKKYLGNKKYRQAAVRKAVKKGTRAIRAGRDIYDVQAAYNKYHKQILKCVKKYRIAVKKHGRGKVILKNGNGRNIKNAKAVYGSNVTLKFKPAPGHRISRITVDGVRVGTAGKYTLKNVRKSHVIRVWFSGK